MAIDTINYLSRYMQETNFFSDQTKLDTMYYLLQGLTYREVAEKIGKQISYVQRVMDYLRGNELLHWGRWSPNVYKIGMKKSIAFLDWKGKDLPLKENYNYTTYLYHVESEGPKVLAIYTYPREDESEIKGERGEDITSFYYTFIRFTVPFFKKIDIFREFFDTFDTVKNDEKILSGTPTFETEQVDDHPITVYICKYSEKLPDLTPGVLTDHLEQDFREYKEIEISYEKVRTILNRMKTDGIIFPRNALYLEPLLYRPILVKIRTGEVYRIMETFNQFNMFTSVALTRDPDAFYLFIQCPTYQFSDVMEILNELDPTHRMYMMTKHVFTDVIYYKWSLEKFLKSKNKKSNCSRILRGWRTTG